jgi:hypothetical protein
MVVTSRSPYSVMARVRGMGVAVMTSTSGVTPLPYSNPALLHPELVLLVNHHQAQILEDDPLLDQGVRADHQLRASIRHGGPGRDFIARIQTAAQHTPIRMPSGCR